MKKLTWALGLLLVLCFGLMVWLCFFQFPSVDDYMGTYYYKKFGYAGSVKWYLNNGNGRFTSIPIFLAIASSKSLLNHYGLLLVALLLITYMSVVGFVKVFSRQLFTSRLNNKQTFLLAALILMTFIAMVPEVSTFIFWLATVVTYTVPFALFLWLLCAWAYLLKEGQPNKWRWAIVVAVLTIFLSGCNEMLFFYSCALPFLIGAFLLVSRKPLPVQLYFIATAALLAGLLVIWLPGNAIRSGIHVTQPFTTSVTGSVFRTLQNLQLIFSNPLFYVSCLGMLITSTWLKPSVAAWFSSKRTHWLLEIVVLIGMLFCFDLLLRHLGHSVLPPRAVNNIICITVLGFWWILLMNAARLREQLSAIPVKPQQGKAAILGTYMVALAGSGFTWELMKNLVTAPIHKAVLQERIELVMEAKAQGRNSVYIPPYETAVNAVIEKKFQQKKRFIQVEFPCPPTFSFFQDEPCNHYKAYFYAEYYGIDSITNTKGTFPRWDLSKYRLQE